MGALFDGCLFVGCLFVGCLFVGCLFVGCLFVGCLFVGCLGFTQQPENSKRAHLSVPVLQTPPKFHEKTPQREKKE